MPIHSSQTNETTHSVNAMKRQFLSSLSALLTVAIMFPAQSVASSYTTNDLPVEKMDSHFVQKSNSAIPYLRAEKDPKQVRKTISVATYLMDENPAQLVSQNALEEGEHIVNSDEAYQQAADAELDNEQRGWLGDTHFPAIYNVALHQEIAEQEIVTASADQQALY